MKQKLNYILTFFILFTSLTVVGQKQPSEEEIKKFFLSDKVAYLIPLISLTPDEAEKFWPVYKEYQGKRIDIQAVYIRTERSIMRNNWFNEREKGSVTDEEITKFFKEYYQKKQEEEELNAKYYEKFLKILPPNKVLSLYKAEQGYTDYLRNRGGNRNNFNMWNR